jgi:Domain of unknown function (DUF4760)
MNILKKEPAKGEITIKYSYLVISFVILFILEFILAYLKYLKIIDLNFSDFTTFFSSGIVAIGLIYTARSLSFQYEINKLKIDKDDELLNLDKLRFTYELTSEWFKSNFPHNAEIVRRFMEPYKGKLSDNNYLDQFNNFLNSEKGLETRKALSSNLNYFESISLLLGDNLIDERSLKKAFKTVFLLYYDNLKEYIEFLQRGNGGSNVRIYKNFVELCQKWHKDSN